MPKEYAFDEVKPDMKGGLTFWSKFLNMGSANLRTAIRTKALEATMEPLDVSKPDIKGYAITGVQILAWREKQHVRSATGAPKKNKSDYKYKTSVAISAETAAVVNDAIVAAGLDFKLIKPEIVRKPKVETEATPDRSDPEPEIDLTKNEAPASKSGLFGLRR